jgi:hypothetical protein
LHLYWGRGTIERILLFSPVADLSDFVALLSGTEMQFTSPSQVQECRPLTPQDAGMILLSMGEWDTHSSSLGL